MGHFIFSLIGLKRILFTNIFQRLEKPHLEAQVPPIGSVPAPFAGRRWLTRCALRPSAITLELWKLRQKFRGTWGASLRAFVGDPLRAQALLGAPSKVCILGGSIRSGFGSINSAGFARTQENHGDFRCPAIGVVVVGFFP